MKFRLEMINHNDSTLYYYWRFDKEYKQWHDDDRNWIIKYPDGKTASYIRYIMGSYSVGNKRYNYKPIKPGKTVILYKKFKINANHCINKPGRYTVQHNGKGMAYSLTNKLSRSYRINVRWLIYKSMETNIKKDNTFSPDPIPSNIVEIDIAPGQLSKDDMIMGKLINILPDKWRLAGMVKLIYPDRKKKVTPEGRGIVEGSGYYLSHYLRHSRVKIRIWFVKKMAAVATKENDPSFQFRTDDPKKRILSEYLGKYSDGYIYAVIPPETEAIWPKFRDKIFKVFNINK